MVKYKVVIADEHPLMRLGISNVLNASDNFEVIAEANNISDVIMFSQKSSPDLILLGLNMHMSGLNMHMSGLNMLKALKEENIRAKVVILTAFNNFHEVRKLVNSRVDGYLLKDISPNELVAQLEKAVKGEAVYSTQVLDTLNEPDQLGELLQKLTAREMDILLEVSQGFRNREIAEKLFISEATVKVHMKSLLKKLNVASRTAATVLFLKAQG